MDGYIREFLSCSDLSFGTLAFVSTYTSSLYDRPVAVLNNLYWVERESRAQHFLERSDAEASVDGLGAQRASLLFKFLKCRKNPRNCLYYNMHSMWCWKS